MNYRIFNLTQNIIVLENVRIAQSYFTRLKGLLGREDLDNSEGLVIKPCNSIHTIGMKFCIDVAFVDKNNIIIHIIKNMAPGKLSPIIKKSAFVIETKAGEFDKIGLVEGDEINLSTRQGDGRLRNNCHSERSEESRLA